MMIEEEEDETEIEFNGVMKFTQNPANLQRRSLSLQQIYDARDALHRNEHVHLPDFPKESTPKITEHVNDRFRLCPCINKPVCSCLNFTTS